ncbi:MAG: hypothetical protein ACTSUE_07390 [Promethearchaeota archaeon]
MICIKIMKEKNLIRVICCKDYSTLKLMISRSLIIYCDRRSVFKYEPPNVHHELNWIGSREFYDHFTRIAGGIHVL